MYEKKFHVLFDFLFSVSALKIQYQSSSYYQEAKMQHNVSTPYL